MITRLRGILIRQLPIIILSLITGAIAIYYLGFWPGVILNATVWAIAVFFSKLIVARKFRNSDPFRDDRFLMYFVKALIGRLK
jgi:hypothetical protein